MNLRARSSFYGVVYLVLVAAALPWAFARVLGSSQITVPSAILGGTLIVFGFVLSGSCANHLLTLGQGTQFPLDPTTKLVVAGPYEYVRNPMVVGNLLLLFGEAVLFLSAGVLLYALLFWGVWHVLLVRFEEPSLQRRFGSDYGQYQQRVPRWLPRLKRADGARTA